MKWLWNDETRCLPEDYSQVLSVIKCWTGFWFPRLIQSRWHNESLLLLFFIHSAVYQLKWASSGPGWEKGFLGFQREKLHLSWDENRNISIFWFPGSRRLLLFIPMYSYTDSLYVFSSVQPTGAVVRFSCRTVAIQALHLCCAMRRRGGHLQMLSGMLTLFVWRCVALTMCCIFLLYVWNSISLGDCIISVTQLPPQH